ncbi:MAG: FG-GAP-like repeat-containing protein [Verrucomicrobiota bacterium]
MKRLFIIALLVFGGLCEPPVTDATAFTDVGTNLVGLSEGWLFWGDYNNDGRLDLLAMGMDSGFEYHTLIYSNAGSSTFTLASNNLPSAIFTLALWGDYDNDGRLDLLIGGGVYHNDGNGALSLAASLPDVNGAPVVWGDFNNDGRLDVLATDVDGRSMVYWNSGTNFIGSGQSFFPNLTGFASISVADFDNDGWLDILLCDWSGSYLFRNLGDGSFAYLGGVLPGINVGAAPLADFDNDGKVDLFLTGSGQATLYHNTGTNTFVSAGNLFSGMWSSTAAWGDFDNDGRPDLWTSGSPNSGPTVSRLFRNTAGGFVDSGIALPALYYASVAWGDFNNDGALDVACFGANGIGGIGTEMHIYRNDGTASNAPPAAPSGLTAVQSNNLVTLSWQAASSPNPGAGLTYNVRIGTTPGGIDILSPMANVATGWRLLPQRGNAGERLFAIFNLPPGTNYYWSVQAVDSAYAGGPFAAETSFAVDTAPVISALADQTVRFGTATPPLPFTIGDFETPPDQLLLSVTSGNTNLLPAAGIVLSRAGSNCTVVLNPAPLSVGTSLVTLTVSDPQGRAASSSLLLTVTNTAPAISQSPVIRVRPGEAVPPVAFVIGDAETPASGLALAFAFSNTNLLQSWAASGSDSNRVLALELKPNQRGTCLVRIVVSDPLGAAATNSFTVQAAGFDPQAAGLPNVDQGGVEWGDFDNDGKPDVLIWGNLPGVGAVCRIYRNTCAGGFVDIGAGLPGISGGVARWGDFDNDGYLDLLVAAANSRGVYRNTHAGSFTNMAVVFPTTRSPTAGGWVDADNDGRLDILLTSSIGTKLFHNNGDGTFTDSGLALPGTSAGAVAWGDYNGDGRLDLALAGGADGLQKSPTNTLIYRNDGNGVFTDIHAGIQAVGQGSVAWGNFDQDGRPDLLLTGINGNTPYTRIYRNNGNDTFSVVVTNMSNVQAGAGVWGDFDNDGLPDIFLAGLTPGPSGITALIYRNSGDGTVANIGEPLVGAYWSGAAWGDFDGDGVLDILYCGTTNGLTSGAGTFLYRSAVVRSNTPPAAPGGLTFLTNQVLSWSAGSDLETTNPAGLTYNLRIGTRPGGIDVLAPDADPVTGRRRVARFGNVGPAARWPACLPDGTYYWSVQTIDTAFAGSPFAAEQVFSLTHFPATGLVSFTAPEDGSLLLLPASPTNSSGQLYSFAILTAPSHGTVVAGPAGQFLYRPDTNFFGNDAFVFQASADGISLAPGIVIVGVTAVPDSSQVLLAIQLLSGNAIELQLTGEPCQDYEFQQSTDVVQWSGFAWGEASPSGTLRVTNNRPATGTAFFRARAIDSIPPLLSVAAPGEGGAFSFNLGNLTPGRSNVVEFSTDLVTWTGLGTNLALSNSLPVTDPDAGSAPQRFYRAREWR